MIIKMTMFFILLLLLLVAAPGVKADAWIKDGSNIITEENILSGKLQGLYDTKGVIIILETFQELENAKAAGKENFKKYGLHKMENGNPMLNLYIVYVNRSNSLKIFYGSRCGLDPQTLDDAMKSELVSGKIAEGTYDEAFLNLIDALESLVAEKLEEGLQCAIEIKKSRMEFTIDPRVYEPRSKENPYGRGLERGQNPYDDGIVTEYDPLVCTLDTSDLDIKGDVTYSFQGTKSGKIASGKIMCKSGKCTASLPPGKSKRGEILTCTMKPANLPEYEASVTAAQYVYMFVPLNLPGVKNIKEQYDFYVDLSAINNKPDLAAKALYSRRCELTPDDFARIGGKDWLKTLKIEHIYGLGWTDVYILRAAKECAKKMGFVWDPEFDRVIGSSGILGFSFAMPHEASTIDVVFMGQSKSERALAHELGHTYATDNKYLCDEYSYSVYKYENSETPCINSFPECCLMGPGKWLKEEYYDNISHYYYASKSDHSSAAADKMMSVCEENGGKCEYGDVLLLKKCGEGKIVADLFGVMDLEDLQKIIERRKFGEEKQMLLYHMNWFDSRPGCPYVKGKYYGVCCIDENVLIEEGTDCYGEDYSPSDLPGYPPIKPDVCAGSPLPDRTNFDSKYRSIYGSKYWKGDVRYPPEAGLPINPTEV